MILGYQLTKDYGNHNHFSLCSNGAAGTTTIESKTNFLGAAKVGATVIGIARPVKLGKRMSVWQTEIQLESGKKVAIVTQSQLVL